MTAEKITQEFLEEIDKRINRLNIKHIKWEKNKLILHSFLSLNWGSYAQTDKSICPICILAKELKNLKNNWVKK